MASGVNKGIILAGGRGKRLYPATRAVSKQLLMVYDKPMIYYPLDVLMQSGIRDILIIANNNDADRFRQLLGDGSQLGVRIRTMEEDEPKGIANAFLLGAKFIGDDNVALILGDNIFCGIEAIVESIGEFEDGALTFGVVVEDAREYGVAELDADGNVLSLEEKPTLPKSDIAVTGLYVYDSSVVDVSRGLRPSKRGELEITDVNREYLVEGRIRISLLREDSIWFDTGNAVSLLEASNVIAEVERTSGRKVGCIEQTAYERGYIRLDQLKEMVGKMPDHAYCKYLKSLF